MSFFKKIGKTLKKVIGVVAAVAAAVFIPGAGAFIGKALLGAAISIGASKLLAKRGADAPAGGDGGGRVPLNPSTDNKLPVVYGSAWVFGATTDAKISQDQKYMWYCISLAEVTDTGNYSYDLANGIYLDGRLVQFGNNGVVTGLITNNSGLGTAQLDTRMSGKIYIWLFTNGSSSGVNTGGQTAIQILSDASTGGGIFPSELRWNGSVYTTGGQSPTMNNTAFAIVRVEYNPDAGTTGQPALNVKLTNNMGAAFGARPGAVILDYLTNDRYGCNIPLSQIDTGSLTTLDAYSNQQVSYIDVNGNPQIQPYRYRINGAVNTAQTCLNNLQTMVDSCDSWLQYSEATGKWRVIMNAPYSGAESNLFLVDSNNLVGGVQINPVDLNETYNQVEVAYPNNNIKDQTDYQVIDLTNPANWSNQNFDDILSPNEAVNRLNISLPLVNSAVQAKYLAARRLLQSREDLVISCDLDYSGIQIEAGDVIRVGQPDYGWGPISTNPSNPYKLFRVSNVSEQTLEDGSLVASIEAFEYNNTVYADNAITDFVPADNTGLTDPNVISKPCAPLVTTLDDIATPVIDAFQVETCVPDEGTVLYMDFNYGTDSNVQTHQLYRTIQSAGGIPFTNSDSANAYFNTISITVNDLAANTYYWSATARNDTAGRYSDGSASYTWGGASIQPYNPDTTRGGLPGTSYRPNSIPASAIAGGGGIGVSKITAGTFITISPTSGLGNVTVNAFEPRMTTIFRISDIGNAVTVPPVDLTTAPSYNIPVYLDGTDPGANYIYPYFQGTSTTANGYLANSTSQYYPWNASVLNMPDGTDNWYIFTALQTANANPTLTSGRPVQLELDMQVAANANTSIQVLPIYTNSGNTYLFGFTSLMDTVECPANTPVTVNKQDAISYLGGQDAYGYAIRNIGANSRATIQSCSFIVRQP